MSAAVTGLLLFIAGVIVGALLMLIFAAAYAISNRGVL